MARRVVQRPEDELQQRLRGRLAEIEEAVLTRVIAASDPAEEGVDPLCSEGLRAAVASAIEYGFSALELNEEGLTSPPPELLAQARLAARNEVSLDIIMRQCVAGHALFVDFLIAESVGLVSGPLKRQLRALASHLDRLLTAIGEEHGLESKRLHRSAERREAELVERLLAGEHIDSSSLDYDLEGHHLGTVAKGPGAVEAMGALARVLDCRLLLIRRDEGVVWAWFGSRTPTDPDELQHGAGTLSPRLILALGEPCEGLSGWRLSHRQATAALPIALHEGKPVTRYADVALLASIRRDDLLASSLRMLYLEPLEAERDGGKTARQTLRAYFATDRNLSSAAALLGVRRHTVASRLRVIEERLGRLSACTTELEVALCLEDLNTLSAPTLPED